MSPRTITAYTSDVRPIARRARSIDDAGLRRWLYAGSWSPATTARRIAAAHSLFTYLARTGQRADDPTDKLDRPRVHRGLPRPIDELERRLALLDEPFRSVAEFLAETGLRISELYGLEPPELGADRLLVHGKGGRDRWVALTARALEVLEGLELPPRVHVTTMQRRFRAAGFTPHRLRHTLGCELGAAGVDLGDIQEILGHQSPVTTRIYTRFGLERQRAAQARRSRVA